MSAIGQVNGAYAPNNFFSTKFRVLKNKFHFSENHKNFFFLFSHFRIPEIARDNSQAFRV